ncbi:hypothetical protein [Arthrobacter castelli]|uniref:hypothetical protein n=1 Tax=Arthrobacter castelli TaxID=271431 RepID=UPI0003F4F589|nr:hypothetical protein [Arthrobacter castelli]
MMQRQEMVSLLSSEGMSTRAIAPIVGANQATVTRDVGRDAFASPEEPAEPVQGMDGKTYTRPTSKLIETMEVEA